MKALRTPEFDQKLGYRQCNGCRRMFLDTAQKNVVAQLLLIKKKIESVRVGITSKMRSIDKVHGDSASPPMVEMRVTEYGEEDTCKSVWPPMGSDARDEVADL
ncbi:hypothetical protein Tco_0936919 [Tanacetum coccineum]|uniref:Uncharacterized protein n=1 Tax=Tanacetum coccineum TaxID=301880 RepID=A0ABQ5DDI2_9ASTR